MTSRHLCIKGHFGWQFGRNRATQDGKKERCPWAIPRCITLASAVRRAMARERKELEDKILKLEQIKRQHQAELEELEYHEKLWNSVQLDK